MTSGDDVRYSRPEFLRSYGGPVDGPYDPDSGEQAAGHPVAPYEPVDITLTRGPRRNGPALGVFACVLAGVTVILFATGMSLAVGDDFLTSRYVGYFAIAASIAGFLVGGFAAITGRGRAWGAWAMVVSVLANPVLLAQALGYLAAVG